MDLEKVDTIAKWPEPQSFRDIQVFNGFANFYCRFIDGFSWVAAGLSNMLKDSKKSKFWGMKFVMAKEALEAFKALKECFMTVPLLVHFNNHRKCLVETDALGSAISAIFLQLVKETGQWHLVVFWSCKKSGAKMNYKVGKGEMLAIVKKCKHWRYYLKGSTYLVRVITDYCNLRTFLTGKTLFCKEARWWEKLSGLDLVIEYHLGRKNPTDRPFRCLDYVASNDDSEQTLCTVEYMTRSLVKADKMV